MTQKLFFFFIFNLVFIKIGACETVFELMHNLNSDEFLSSYENCTEIKDSEKVIQLGGSTLDLQQGAWGGCYIVSPLRILKYELGEIDQKWNRGRNHPSLSTSCAVGSNYTEGGLAVVFLYKLLAEGQLYKERNEIIGHRSLINLYNKGASWGRDKFIAECDR